MTICALHTSDLHGRLDLIRPIQDLRFDVWIDSGDLLPNISRHRRTEQEFQPKWLKREAKTFLACAQDKPFFYIPGNHDFIELDSVLPWAQRLESTRVAECGPLRLTGFREINYIIGEWAGEAHAPEIRQRVEEIQACRTAEGQRPNVLVTHAPPAGVLDVPMFNTGLTTLSNYLVTGYYGEQPHSIRHHFFGHQHDRYGSVDYEHTRFYNGAEHVTLHTLNFDV